MMMMMKLEGELYAARLRLDGLAAKSNRITCRPALVAGTCALGCQTVQLPSTVPTGPVLQALYSRIGSTDNHPVAAVGQGSCMILASYLG